ncbi:MAG: 50S ribosomal protein L11 methyltransferase [Flavobacteriales bacterium]
MNFNKKDIIRLKQDVEIKISATGFKIISGTQYVYKSAAFLKILEVFRDWKSLEDGMNEVALMCKEKNAFFNASTEFHDLLKKDFFEKKEDRKTVFGFHKAKFDAFPVHLRMLNDHKRSLGFQKAIREIVGPNDIVLDIGTGNGILAATAAMAGAKHVYAIERSGFIEVARAVFKANGLEDKITLLKGDSTTITLPEKATVLVSEIIGNDAFDEGILRTFDDAKERLLVPGAKIIPGKIKVYALATESPALKYGRSQLSKKNIAQWKKDYKIDFSAFFDFDEKQTIKASVSNSELKNHKFLSDPILLTEIDFHQQDYLIKDCEKNFSITQPGNFNSYFIYFEAELSKDNVLSLHPDELTNENSWGLQLFYLPWEKEVEMGEVFKLDFTLKNLKSVIKISG